MPITEGARGIYIHDVAAAPVAGTDEVNTLSNTGTAGTFRVADQGFVSATIPWNATAAQVDTALEALPSIGTGGVVCTGGQLPTTAVTITFSGAGQAKKARPTLTIVDNQVTGGTPSIAKTTTGVNATFRGAAIGALLVHVTTAPKLFQNNGTAQAPTWQVVGTQT